ncbi:ABC transporter permease [Deinococcus sp. KSM4-11]|uniref:ABC transporter permease n=1 Tax=Deinococcus sp. KSM4-11 TaxID=2568654 RepID=UPI0010A4D1BF|nr:ABC transporter permease [Deinococcus sp. KSM4-11]THF83928.1 ABC transporter permease [Deinococcus sp. KSM4-11]
MLNFIVRRLIQIPLVMLVLSLLIVGLTQLLTPEQRAAPYIRNEQQAAHVQQIIKERGLDKPFIYQYGKWFGGVVHGDLGFSKASGKDVVSTIAERLPATIELTILTTIPILVFAVWLGTLAALHKDKLIDQIVRVFTTIGFSLPTFVLGILLLAVFYAYLGWLPGAGQLNVLNQFALGDLHRYTGMLTVDAALNGRWDITWDVLQHMVLPAITLIVVLSPQMVRVMRNSMLETLTSDFVRTARAKGLSPRIVNTKHARRNALLPLVTLSGFLIIGLLGGSLITESIFAYPGVGQWVVQAAFQIDLAAVLGFALLTALIVVILQTVVDILYGVIDPRVRFD